jgi:ribulose-5-phosphate 4-epimerase/fuculose-1-phosphate aldolase
MISTLDPVRQARIDLAASHRLAVWHGLNEGICNHFTANVPGRPGFYFSIPYGLHWAEVKASDFLVVDYKGKVVEGEGEVELTSWCIHAPLHRLRAEAQVVMHTHMPFATALSLIEDFRMEPVGQSQAIMGPMICYDDAYTGLACDPSEGERLAAKLEPNKPVMMLAQHGVLVVGRSVADAYDRLYYMERAAMQLVYASFSGRKLRRVPPDIAKLVEKQVVEGLAEGGSFVPNGASPMQRHFDALKRLLDRREPDYKE